MGLLLPLLCLFAAKPLVHKGDYEVIDDASGMCVTMPTNPSRLRKEEGSLYITSYVAKKDQETGYVLSILSGPPDDEHFLGTKALDQIDAIAERFIPMTFDSREPTFFGPCRGYAYSGHSTYEGLPLKIVARLLQVGTNWVIMEGIGKDPGSNPDTEDYFNSLRVCINGKPPVGEAQFDDTTAVMHASIDAALARDDTIDSDQPGGKAYGFIANTGSDVILFRSFQFDDEDRETYLSQVALNKAQGQIEDFLNMKETSDSTFYIGTYAGKEFEMEDENYHAKARLFGFGNQRFLIVYKCAGDLDGKKADGVLNSFRIDFHQIDQQ